MFSFDLQDGYFAVGIHPEHRRYMTFALPPAPGSPPGAPPRYFQCAAMPFGWATSPLIFTKVMRVMVQQLRSPTAATVGQLRRGAASGRAMRLRLGRRGDPTSRGMRVLPYVDDFLVMAATRAEALRCRQRVTEVLAALGIARHPEKAVWEPTQRLEHLGLDVDAREGLFRVPPRKLQGLMTQARSLICQAARSSRWLPARVLASFVGYAQSVELACPMARLYLRALHDAMATRASWGSDVRLTRQALRDLRWWREIGTADVSRAIWRPPTDRTLHCDASRLAWGGVLDGTVPAQGFWEGRTRGRHINWLELMAVYLSLQRWEGELQGASLLLWEDNMTIVHVLTNRTTRSPQLMHLLRKVWRLIDSMGVHLTVRHIRSEDNSLADALSRGSPFDDLELLPAEWRRLERAHGPHTVDCYAAEATARVARFYSLLPEPRSAGAAALAQDWRGENAFVFPPPSELPRIAQLLHEQPQVAATVVVPHWPAQAWFQGLASIADEAETRPLHEVASPPGWLPGSAQHALSGAMLTCFRVPAHRGGCSARG
jgi:biotin operon repressor